MRRGHREKCGKLKATRAQTRGNTMRWVTGSMCITLKLQICQVCVSSQIFHVTPLFATQGSLIFLPSALTHHRCTHAYTHLFCRRDAGPVLPCRICGRLMSMTDGGGSEDHVACRPWVTELQSISRPCRMFSLLWMNIL